MDAKQTRNPADRAVASIRAAVGRLALLPGDEDPATFETAAMALGAIGSFAVGPMAAASRAGPSFQPSSARHAGGGRRLAGGRVRQSRQ
jgi:hypothetical protein